MAVSTIEALHEMLMTGYRRQGRWFVIGSEQEIRYLGGIRVMIPIRYLSTGDSGFMAVCGELRGRVKFASHVGAIELTEDTDTAVEAVYCADMFIGVRYRRSVGVVAYRTVETIDVGQIDVGQIDVGQIDGSRIEGNEDGSMEGGQPSPLTPAIHRLTAFIHQSGLSLVTPAYGFWLDGGRLWLEYVDILPSDEALELGRVRQEQAVYVVDGASWTDIDGDVVRWLRSGGATFMSGLELVGEGRLVWV